MWSHSLYLFIFSFSFLFCTFPVIIELRLNTYWAFNPFNQKFLYPAVMKLKTLRNNQSRIKDSFRELFLFVSRPLITEQNG